MKERLQKVLARAGLASRREVERWIEQGRVSVNGKVASLGDRVSPEDKLTVDGKPVAKRKLRDIRPRVLIYNKPVGEICTRSDPEGRRTVFQKLPRLEQGRWIAIGRLDINTSGLLLFTNDGELANKMMHPSSQIDREYAVRVMGNVDDAMIERLKSGVMLEDGLGQFTDIQRSKTRDKDETAINQWFYCVLMEGRNREVRRLWESQGVKVNRLKRVRYGPVFVPPRAKEGMWVELTDKEVKALYEEVGLKTTVKAMSPRERQHLKRRFRKQKPR